MSEKPQIGWATITVILGFLIYELFTMVFQFTFLLAGDLIEMGLDIIFIILLVFFYDVDALILLIELIPFVDLIPLFVIYMLLKISTTAEGRNPLFKMSFPFSNGEESQTQQKSENNHSIGYQEISPGKNKIYLSETGEEVCVICMQQLEDGDEVITCENDHLAHVKHIKPWTEKREFCPICRVEYPRVLISKTYRKEI